ncbi:MAG TPA: universal stress protein [Synergistales bacterium]|jgi:nucleotide-binding universal stress UspA family protein|nr:universal stress protein [Synergistaceae bacterium]HOO86588.1 universal stress protein [Synergistales bacterium]
MLTRILFFADVSSFSERALAWAARQVAGDRSDFLILHVVDRAAGLDAPELVREAEGYLEEMCARTLPPESYYKTLVLLGDLLESLPDTIRSEKCTFAIFPLPGGEDGMPLVRATPAPQILLREHEGFFPEEDTFGSLAVALDLEPSRTSLMLDNLREFLAQARKNPKITLLHALAPQSAEDAPEVLNAGRQALEEVRDEISSWGYETSAEIVSGDPSKELPARIRELAPSLLVIGLPVAGELGELVFGSTAEMLFAGTTCPLLVFPL